MSNETVLEWGNGGGTIWVYAIEARLNYPTPKEYNGMMLDNRWRRVHFPSGPIGVPVDLWTLHPETKSHGFLNYDAAMALAYWFMAGDPNGGVYGLMSNLCVETRLVKIKYEYSYKTTELGVGEIMGVGDRERDAKFAERQQSTLQGKESTS